MLCKDIDFLGCYKARVWGIGSLLQENMPGYGKVYALNLIVIPWGKGKTFGAVKYCIKSEVLCVLPLLYYCLRGSEENTAIPSSALSNNVHSFNVSGFSPCR